MTTFAERQANLQSVLGTMAAEGEHPDAEAMAVFQRYVNGELDLPAVGRAIDELTAKLIGRHVNAA